MNTEDLGQQLRSVRKEHKLSLKDLAQLTGVHWVTLSRFENGYAELGVRKLARIAQALGLQLILQRAHHGYTLDDLAKGLLNEQPRSSPQVRGNGLKRIKRVRK